MSLLRCPRNLIGYGPNPPKVKWPKDARIAVSFVLNYEEGGENCILNDDKHSENYICEIIGTEKLDNNRNLIAESTYEYGSRVGVYRILNLFKKYNINFTTFAVGKALEYNKEIGNIIINNGNELASHDYRWIDYSILSKEKEKEHLLKVVSLHKKYYNQHPKGIYVGRYGLNSKDIIQEVGQFEWCSDAYNDDIPYYYYYSNSKNSNSKNYEPLLIIPYSLDTNDMKFLSNGSGFATSNQFFEYLKDSFDVKYEETGKMMSIGLHCRISGHPGRIKGLEMFIQYITQPKFKDKVWIAKRIDIAKFWKKNFPPNPAFVSSKL